MTDGYQQPYDSTLKALVQTYAATILPLFLAGVTFLETLNVELLRPTMRADRVFKVLYRDKPHILHLEFESGSDSDMSFRLLTYHAIIYQEYHVPVISMIIYPFQVPMAVSPLREMSRHEEIVTFHFQVLPLWTLHAEQYVRDHAVSIYALLPTMQGVTDDLLLQAMKELTEYYHDNEIMVARQFVWMGIMVRRSDTITREEKARIQKELRMYDKLWDEDPEIQRIKAEAKAEGKVEGKIEAKVEASQEMIVGIVEARFPELVDLAQERVEKIRQLEMLNLLAKQIVLAPDEATARWTLGTFAA